MYRIGGFLLFLFYWYFIYSGVNKIFYLKKINELYKMLVS